jgi:hypothetical protein
MMKLKSLVAALALGMSGMASAASLTETATFNLSITDLPDTYAVVESFSTGRSFMHTWNFDFASAADVTGMLWDMQIGGAYNINNFMVNLNGSGWTSLPGDMLFGSATVPAGTYALGIKGDVVGAYGGAYSLSFAAVPVPEAETWAMILAGLGLVGLRARKQMKNAERLVG